MSVKQHINASRTITGFLEAINIIGVILGALVAVGVLFQSGTNGVGALLICVIGTFIWWFLNKLAYIGLQLLTDITELLHKQQTA